MIKYLLLFSLMLCYSYAQFANDIKFPLHTKGSKIVDANEKRVKLACVNWYGAHMERYVVNGLDQQALQYLAKDIADKGFNCVRLVFSLEQFKLNPLVKQDAILKNPQLFGKTSMEIFSATLQALTDNNILVILNNHMSDAKWCCSLTDNNGLWFNERYSKNDWINTLEEFTKLYKDNEKVIAFDIRNEIRDYMGLQANWGEGGQLDWRAAAIEASEKILQINNEMLIIIEGLNYATELQKIKENPITLSVPNKLIYSGHFYSWTSEESGQSYEQFKDYFVKTQGYITSELQMPLWIGEIGEATLSVYWQNIIRYLKENDSDWAYWAYNGYKTTVNDEETFGILNAQMNAVRHDWKLKDLQSIQKVSQTNDLQNLIKKNREQSY